MIRSFHCVIALLLVTALGGCQTDYQVLNDQARSYVAAHNELDRKIAAAITANRLQKGMNKEQVIAAWGDPVVVQQFDNSVEYWFFDCVWPHQCESLSFGMSSEEQYLSRALFRDGKIIEWQD